MLKARADKYVQNSLNNPPASTPDSAAPYSFMNSTYSRRLFQGEDYKSKQMKDFSW
jgi:hypothetical protein